MRYRILLRHRLYDIILSRTQVWRNRKILGKRRKRKRVQTQRVSAKAKSARLNNHWASSRMGATILSWDSTDNPLHWHENHWWEWICRKSTCDFEDMGRCPANHNKSQTNFSTYTEIVVALQMEQIQTTDWQMGITPMVSCHSWHHRLCPLFISLSK